MFNWLGKYVSNKYIRYIVIFHICFHIYRVVIEDYEFYSHKLSIYPADFFNHEEVEFQIYNVEPAVNDTYEIFTKKGKFTNRDSLINMKFNSADIQNYIFRTHEHKEVINCKADVNGFRVRFLSSFPNITNIQCW